MSAKDDCYKLIQEIAVARDVVCQRPECGRPADCGHHLFKRDRMATAFLPEAVVGVCAQDHTGWAHAKPREFKAFMVEKRGNRYYELARLSETVCKHQNYAEIRAGLRENLRMLMKQGGLQ